MPKIKAEINQVIKIDDATLEKLQAVDGNVYIFNNNTGSPCIQIETTESKLAEALVELLDVHECDLREILNIVKKALVEYAYCKHGSLLEAGKHLGYKNPRSLYTDVRLTEKGLEFVNNLKKVRSLPMPK